MKKKILALVLSSAMVLNGSAVVFAEDTAAQSTEEESLEAVLGDLLGGEEGQDLDLEGLLGSVTDENGELDLEGILGSLSEGEEGDFDLNGLLGSVLGGEEGDLDLNGLLGSVLGGEEGDFDINGLLSSIFGGEEGSFDLGSILSTFGIEESDLDLDAILGSLFDEEGNFDLEGILGQFGLDEQSLDIGGILDMAGDFGGESFAEELKSLEAEAGAADGEVSLENAEAMINELLENPDEAMTLVDSLFKEGGIAASLLDLLGSTGETFSGVVDTMKDASGEYSLDSVLETLGTIEGNDEGLSIAGQEITEQDIESTVTQLMEVFGLSGEQTAEADAAA